MFDGVKLWVFVGEEVDVFGIGVGLFNLSLVVLLVLLNGLCLLFVECWFEFCWYFGLMFVDLLLMISFLKDFVMLVDLCSCYLFIVFL